MTLFAFSLPSFAVGTAGVERNATKLAIEARQAAALAAAQAADLQSQNLKLPRFRGVLASLVDYASVGWTSIACS